MHLKPPTDFSSFISSISTDFNLSPTYLPYLESHYLLHWSSSWLYKQAKDDLTTLEHNGIIYLINWADLPESFKGQVKLSFRKPFCSSFGFCILQGIYL